MSPNTSASNSAGLVSDSYNKFSGTRGGNRVSGANVSITGGQAGPQFKSKFESLLEKAKAERDVDELMNPWKKLQRQQMEYQLEIQKKAVANPGEFLKNYEKSLRSQPGQTEATIATNLMDERNRLEGLRRITNRI